MTARFLFPLVLAVLVSACATPPQRTAVPEALADAAHLDGFGQIRFWGDEDIPEAARHETILPERNDAGGQGPVRINILALSGGGEDGAFGAGLLKGWSAEGSRPDFNMVTGVSTGALIAPFAFLGPAYDDALEDAYTRRQQGDIFKPALLRNVLGGEGLADAGPLAGLIETYIDADLLQAVAAEHARGRRLLVITTNIDAGRPVVWDIGAIATQGGESALELVRRVILASAAIPGLFPAVAIDVETESGPRTELHADGGITANVFAYQPQLELGLRLDELPYEAQARLYVIHNGSARPSYAEPRPLWRSVAGRALEIFLFSSAQKDISRIYHLAVRDGVEFRLAFIPDSFTDEPDEFFDPVYMRALFVLGEQLAQDGYPWRDQPY